VNDDQAYPAAQRGLYERYGIELLFAQPLSGGTEDLQRRLGAAFEVFQENDATAVVLRSDCTIRGTMSEVRAVDQEQFAPSLQQSWWWRDAAATVQRCREAVLVVEEAPELLPVERFARFQRLLFAVVKALGPAALHWVPTQQFIRPASFLEAMEEVGFEYPALGALNVRLYGLTGGGNMLMDTLGLGALGLWDLQCHFHDLPPNQVATWLLETARKQFLGEGPPLRNGGALLAPDGIAHWRLRAEDALMPPERVLLDVDPGHRYAAGVRE
jgi:hypothetical protein